MQKKEKMILKEYFDTVSVLLSYKENKTSLRVMRRIFDLLCDVENAEKKKEYLWKAISDTSDVTNIVDCRICENETETEWDPAHEFKFACIKRNEIAFPNTFDEDIVYEQAIDMASAGNASAGKFLAAVSWLGEMCEKNQERAIRIWTRLAFSGDTFVMKMLEYAYGANSEKDKAKYWKNIRNIVETAKGMFVKIVSEKTHPGFEKNTLDCVNLILAVKNRIDRTKKENLDLYMLEYISDVEVPFEKKIEAVARIDDFCVLLNVKEKTKENKYGFTEETA